MEPQAELSGPYRLRGKGKFSTRHELHKSRRMLKGPALKSSDLHLPVIKFKFRTYDDDIGPKIKKSPAS